jgi:hypothetical protein
VAASATAIRIAVVVEAAASFSNSSDRTGVFAWCSTWVLGTGRLADPRRS